MGLPEINHCTQGGCKAECCRNIVMHHLNPKATLPWLQELPEYNPIGSPEELETIQKSIDNKENSGDEPGRVSVVMTGKGLEAYIEGLCPSNGGPKNGYNCQANNRPAVCETFEKDGIQCLVKRNRILVSEK